MTKRAGIVVMATMAALLAPSAAQAAIYTENEPDTTKPVAQPTAGNAIGNSWFFRYTVPDRPTTGSPGNCGTTYGYSGTTASCPRYRWCIQHRSVPGSYVLDGCFWNNQTALSQNPNSVTYPSLTLTGLSSGTTYEACATQEYYDYNPPAGWVPLHSYQCESTKIDSGAPSSSLTINNGAAWTNDANLSLRITYSDSGSAAWPATFMCQGSPCSSLGSFNYDSACSSYPASGASCTKPVSGDGQARWCSSVSDSAVPDNPPSSSNDVSRHDQFASAFANFANLSAISCDTILVDRTGPTITASANPTSATTGQAVAFSASATDGGIGPSGSYSWNFGDGANGSGASPSHAYSAAGTYTATVTSADQLGNSSTRNVTVTVTAPAGGNPGGGNPGGGSPGTGTGNGGGGTSDPGTVDPSPAGGGGAAGGDSPGGASGPAAGGEAEPTILAPRSASLRVDKKGAFKLPGTTVQCPGGGAPCKVSGKAASGRRSLGSGAFTLAAGGSKGVTLKLSRTGLVTLRKRKSLRLTVTLLVTRGNAKTTRTLTVTLKPSRR
jgi:hypothetical protein